MMTAGKVIRRYCQVLRWVMVSFWDNFSGDNMKIKSIRLSIMVGELIARYGKGSVWIDCGNGNPDDPSGWPFGILYLRRNKKIAISGGGLNRQWTKCSPKRANLIQVKSTFWVTEERLFIWMVQGY